MQARPRWSAGAARWLTGTLQPVCWLTTATILAHAADRESAKARGDLATRWECREFSRRYLHVRPRAACDTSRWPEATRTHSENSRARREVETAQLEATVRSFRARRADPRSIEGEMTRGATLPNTIPGCWGQCLPSPLSGGGVTAVNGDRALPSPIAPQPQPETTPVTGRWPVPGSCRCSCGGSKRRARAGQRLRSGGGLGRASSRSSSAAPIIQCSSINRRTLCISVIGRESHRGG
jgi:hypothetical protein